MSKRKESLSVLVAEHMQLDALGSAIDAPRDEPVQRRGDVLAELRRGAATRPVLEALEEAVAARVANATRDHAEGSQVAADADVRDREAVRLVSCSQAGAHDLSGAFLRCSVHSRASGSSLISRTMPPLRRATSMYRLPGSMG